MTLSMYQASVPVLLHGLTAIEAILDKAAEFAEARKFDPSVLLNARLAPDMHPLSRQVQIATDMAKGTAVRLAGQELPRFEDHEATFAELRARVQKTIAFLNTLRPEQFAGAETRPITLKLGPPGSQREVNFEGLNYLLGFGTPNVYFHYTMVYALLRHNGLELGKPDYVGPG